MPRPNSGWAWISMNKRVPELLRGLASGDIALTHEALDSLPGPRTIAYLRGLLVTHGCLPRRDENLLAYDRWLATKLDSITNADQRKLIERYTRWHVMRRLRGQLPPCTRDRQRLPARQAAHHRRHPVPPLADRTRTPTERVHTARYRRVVRQRHEHQGMQVKLGKDWINVPEPAAVVIRVHLGSRPGLNTAANPNSPLVFPGRMPGRTMHVYSVANILRDSGIPPMATRSSPPSTAIRSSRRLGHQPKDGDALCRARRNRLPELRGPAETPGPRRCLKTVWRRRIRAPPRLQYASRAVPCPAIPRRSSATDPRGHCRLRQPTRPRPCPGR